MTEEIEKKLNNVNKENQKLKEELNAKEKIIDTLTSKLKETEGHVNKLVAEKNNLIGDKAEVDQDAFNHITKLKEVIGIKDKRIEKLERDIELMREDKAKLQEKLKEGSLAGSSPLSCDNTKIETIENELNIVKTELETTKTSYKELLTKFNEMEKRNDNLTKENSDIQNEFIELRQQLKELQEKNQVLVAQQNKKQEETLNPSEELPAPAENTSKLMKKISVLEEENKLFKTQCDEFAEDKKRFHLSTEKLAEIEIILQQRNTEYSFVQIHPLYKGYLKITNPFI